MSQNLTKRPIHKHVIKPRQRKGVHRQDRVLCDQGGAPVSMIRINNMDILAICGFHGFAPVAVTSPLLRRLRERRSADQHSQDAAAGGALWKSSVSDLLLLPLTDRGFKLTDKRVRGGQTDLWLTQWSVTSDIFWQVQVPFEEAEAIVGAIADHVKDGHFSFL